MSTGVVIIQPYDYIGPRMIPGHKKDLLIIINFLISQKIPCLILYCRHSKLYYSDGKVCNFNIIDLIYKRVLNDYKLFFSPLYRFRRILPFLTNNECIFYVADSVLKTSVQAFMSNPLLIHRLIYAIITEFLLRRHQIIVASHDEHSWFTSCGHSIDRINIIPPMPINDSCKLIMQNRKDTLILIYNPTGYGVELSIKLINKLVILKKQIRFVISGSNSLKIKNSLTLSKNVIDVSYIDDLDSLLAETDLVMICDVGGSGVCNRALQIRSMGIRLVCTPDSVRGTSLHLDPGVNLFNEVNEGISIILSLLEQKERIGSKLAADYVKNSMKSIEKFVFKCLQH